MRILFVGIFYKLWYGLTNTPCAQVLANFKNQVTIFDYVDIAEKSRKIRFRKYSNFFYRLFDLKRNQRYLLPNWVRNLKYYVLGNWRMNRLLLERIKKNHYNLIFLLKADRVNYNLIREFNRYSKTWFFFMDPVDTALALNAQKYAPLSTWSSSTFTDIVKWFKKEGGNSFFIPEGYNSKIYLPVQNIKKRDLDLIFIGSYSPKRGKYIRYLRANKLKVEVYGEGWKNAGLDVNQVVSLYHRTKIILNFIRENDTGFSNRVFIVLGTRSFLLSEYCPDLELVFKRGVHLDWFKTPEECVKKIFYYLEYQEEREKIASQGYLFNLQNFTWEKKWYNILRIISYKDHKESIK